MEEKWKDVVGYEEYFKVSDLGRIYSKRTNKILKLGVSKTGYSVLSTRIGGRAGKAHCFRIHRLVAQAFIDNPEDKSCVNHKDGDKLNNHVINLEWCTQQENVQHAVDIGLTVAAKGENSGTSKLTNEQIRYIRRVYKPFCDTFGVRALAKKFGVVHSGISRIVNNKSWNHIE